MKKLLTGILVVVVFAAVLAASVFLGDHNDPYYNDDGSFAHIDGEDSFGHVEKHPAFSEFASFIIPWKDPLNQIGTPLLSLNTVCTVNRFHTGSVVDGINCVIDAANDHQIYYDFYSEEERREDPSKEETGLIFLPGEPGAPVAFVAAGGGYTCVCLFSEGFQCAHYLHDLGYNVFLLKYRVDTRGGDFEKIAPAQEPIANEDFGNALKYLFENQEKFGVSMEGYSCWGFSAGGRTTFLWGLDNEMGYKAWEVPEPGALVFAYSGWYDDQFEGQYGTMPPSYFAWLPEDNVIGKTLTEQISQMIRYMEENGMTVADHAYYDAFHGFGDGRGTDAEDWIIEACEFWEAQIAVQ